MGRRSSFLFCHHTANRSKFPYHKRVTIPVNLFQIFCMSSRRDCVAGVKLKRSIWFKLVINKRRIFSWAATDVTRRLNLSRTSKSLKSTDCLGSVMDTSIGEVLPIDKSGKEKVPPTNKTKSAMNFKLNFIRPLFLRFL